ncbi:ImcF-related family protein, partial [Paraburkholderia sediminicola]|uniref:ImcF-related family protein n=1 Tax=Paraburkholderia sediminicola TaxID=458836 RepID=UPI0038B9B1D5
MYFDDYAQHWQSFANSIQWEPAATLPAVAEQLRLFADARQSPLIALMKALDYQGRAGENVESLSDLSDTRNYASLIAASLGEQWSGLGESLFLRPVDQAMQAVLRPAQASLNDAWRQSVVEPWARSFQGRYPFASSGDDASFPELVRFIRDQTGLIPAFINQQLAGALELHGDQWVPGSAGAQG